MGVAATIDDIQTLESRWKDKLVSRELGFNPGCKVETMQKANWRRSSDEFPPEGVEVDTKFETEQGAWNLVPMTRKEGRWYFGDYVLAGQPPSHWKLRSSGD